ncbi:SLATT domain-containing protein [Acinetobacter baumannii]|uniref:SLATT domain-containing protein n=1 Tax=Acinetobacter baumannii TaxID=470 RepID=UPI0004508C1D|nr:SLATT domain-containing protein [Acinetobacter baumannii]EXI36440.1 putative membrane protein [Acinetobacter baumannii 846928]MDV7599297.1 SLATT domain-containing protein [Acinetobacter baumannii]HAV3169802.1 SLATT domain-containing protein [Acinetobacter baumannii]HEI8442346.1 SLATT domain-containing protein [Acinetobacter baumannii]
METNSQRNILEEQIRECFGRTVWTHKTHEKCADILSFRQNFLKITQILISGLVTTGILASVFGDSSGLAIVAAIFSFLLTLLNTFVKNYDLGALAQKHSDAAIQIWNIRENYLSLLTDIQSNSISIEQIIERRDLYQKELFEIYKGTPRTFSKAYSKATKALKECEELTFSDSEIDILLPKSLRKINK